MNMLESQIETRSRLDTEMTERAYSELASSINGPASSFPSIDSVGEVDGAVQICLHYLGVEAGKVPDSVTDEDERINWMCRPSATMRRQVRLDSGWQNDAFGVMLGHLDTGEAIALIPAGKSHYNFFNPQSGDVVRVTKGVAKHISQEATLFYKPLPPEPLKITDLARFIFEIFDFGDYLLVLGTAVMATALGFVPAWAYKVAFGTVVPSGQASLIAPVAALMLGMTISTTLITICRTLAMARVSTKIDMACEAATFSRTLSLPSSFFRQYSSGNLGSRVHSMASLAQVIVSIFFGSGLSAVLALSYLLQIFSYASSLVIPSLVIILAQAALTIAVTVLTNRYEVAASEASASLSGTVTALLNGVQKIKLAGAENRAFAQWAHAYSAYARPSYNRPVLLRALPAIVAFISTAGTIVIYYIAGSTHVTISDYMAFSTSFGLVSGAIMTLAGVADQIVSIRTLFRMAQPILEATPETAEDKPSIEKLTGGIEVSNLYFRYGENLPYVLKNLSFRIRPGEYVALVGKSGCGKSTIMRLLLGFERPERGSIFYGPFDVSKIDLQSLRKHIGVVTQDGKLFMGDLCSNIIISTPQATLDDAWAAAEISGIADDIRKMPMGMQTYVTEGGGGISGGQRQRIMIARAVCGNRRILMLDEATSALDNVTQKHVADSLEKLNCTRLVIAHRLSTVRHCDRILVVDDGRIAEEGTYEELIAKQGLFAELVERQRLDKDA